MKEEAGFLGSDQNIRVSELESSLSSSVHRNQLERETKPMSFFGCHLFSLVRVFRWRERERDRGTVVEGIYGTEYGDHLGRRADAIRVKISLNPG